jgi:sugar/nucleoside kinase (ribokinase family)
MTANVLKLLISGGIYLNVRTVDFPKGELRAQVVTVTRGHHGSLTLGAEGETAEVPVLSRQVVDTVGAGDAYLSVAAPCARLGYPPELTGFLGNAVGALAVRIVGNAQPVTPENLVRFIRAVMK